MIVLDTNVVSELMRTRPNSNVFDWIAAHARHTLYTTSLTQAEILFGISTMPVGRRRSTLAASAELVFKEDFEGRILSFVPAAAAHFAEIVALRRQRGRPIETFDALIAATALAAGAAGFATRDLGGFEGCGLKLFNPWQTS